jgi:hypothetical protein
MVDNIVSLAFSMKANPGVYAVLLGSGVSRAASIPTGYEVVLDLCRKLGGIMGEDVGEHPDVWYAQKYGHEARYDELIEALAKTPSERRNLLNNYFVPSDEDREHGRKVPTTAHRAIATLVLKGSVRLILTTNFDRLMESALDEVGAQYDVVSTEDALNGVRPLIHSHCMIVKAHGDYRDTRIRNTQHELTEYSGALNAFLNRVFDEFGLIVAGWSGAWDIALRNAMLRCPARRYSWYWASRGDLTEHGAELVRHRGASVIPVDSADSFFGTLSEMISSLERLESQHPATVEMAIETTKRWMVQPDPPIGFNDLFMDEVRSLLERIQKLPSEQSEVENVEVEFQRQLVVLCSYSEKLARMMSIVGFYGGSRQQRDVIRRVMQRLGEARGSTGLTVLAKLRLLPALMCAYAAGVAAVAGEQYEVLRSVLVEAKVAGVGDRDLQPVIAAIVPRIVFEQERLIPRPEEREFTPANNLLFDTISPWVADLVGTNYDYIRCFDLFELLSALSFAHRSGRDNPIWGCFGWRRQATNTFEEYLSRGGQQGPRWPVIEQLFDNDTAKFEEVLARYDEQLSHMTARTNHYRIRLIQAYQNQLA